ncbi:hypothetical protein [Streptococcus danieliae]|uniref:hypothetical protein n=1 Tax=Streptococcus danieliae TaxID=747656 RepID=UPI001D167122|nr:hypothetical protein [Streptococcus danieliae]
MEGDNFILRKAKVKYVIFSFEMGDYLCNEDNHILVFDTLGLAYQYLQLRHQKPVPAHRTNKLVNPDVYQAPFKLLKVC